MQLYSKNQCLNIENSFIGLGERRWVKCQVRFPPQPTPLTALSCDRFENWPSPSSGLSSRGQLLCLGGKGEMWSPAHQNSYTTPVISVRHWDHHLSLPLWYKIMWSIEGPNDRERSHAPNMVKWTNPTSKASCGADSEAREGKSGVSLKVLGFKVVLLSKYQRLPVGVFSSIRWVDDVVLRGNRCQRQHYKLVIGGSLRVSVLHASPQAFPPLGISALSRWW